MLVAVHDTPQTLTVRPWPDSVLDDVGHDPRSPYVERFWLGVLGPSSVVFHRRLAAELEANPSGFELPLEETAKTLGLGMRGGRNSPFLRTINRCAQFHLVHLMRVSFFPSLFQLVARPRHRSALNLTLTFDPSGTESSAGAAINTSCPTSTI